MPMIRETIVTTMNAQRRVHLAPLGIIPEGDSFILAPFRPSTTLENLRVVPFANANYTDDVRVFAGCLTGRRDWPVTSAQRIPVPRLASALAHAELEVTHVTEDEQRPRFHCRLLSETNHAPFRGFNRAKAAVIEAAILVSRLHLLPREKIERDIEYLRIAVEKTADAAEKEAWDWLMDKVADHYASASARAGSIG